MFYISEWWKHITIIIWWFAGALKRENASTIEDDDKEGSVNNGWFAGAFACLFLPMQRTGICASFDNILNYTVRSKRKITRLSTMTCKHFSITFK
jgi:hypothetical protein